MGQKGWLVSNGKGRGTKYRLKPNMFGGGQVGGQVGSQVDKISEPSIGITVSEWHILQSLQGGNKSSKELKTESLKDKALSGAFKERLAGLRKKGFIEYTIPDKPKSSKQKYRLTEQGKKILREK